MYLLPKIISIATIVISSTSFAADKLPDLPDAGRLLRESAPPPTVEPRLELPKIQKPVEEKKVLQSDLRVKVSGFTFTGNTVISTEELTNIMSGFVGKELTLQELNAAAVEITALYRSKGYFLASTNIPPQTIKAETPIALEIIEGILDEVRLVPKPAELRTPRTLLKRYIDRVPTGKPADENELTNLVMRINDIPGIDSRILLEPGGRQGTTRALLEVTEGKPYSLTVDTDNHGSYSTGYYRIGSSLELYSPLHLGDLFTLRAQSSFSGDTQSVQTGYSLPVSGSGTKVAFNYSFVTYQLGKSFKALDASGNAHDSIVTLTQPVIRSKSLILNLSIAGEYKLLDDRTKLYNQKNQRHTTAGQTGVSGVEIDSWLGGGSTSFSLNYVGGFVGIDDEETKTKDQSSTGLHTNGGYNKLAMSLYRNQSIYKSLTFYTGANGQWAGNNLDSAEQFSLGGPSGVRAFPVSEASGDMGFVSTAEFRYLFDNLGRFPGSLQLAGFIDRGYAVIHGDPVAADNTRNLAGAGVGVSWFDSEGLSIRTSIAWRTLGTASGKSGIEQPTVYYQAVKRF